MTEASIKVKGDTLEFQNIDALYFPKICIICGNSTNNKIEKDVIGKYSFHKAKGIDYNVKIPVCKTCTDNINVNKINESVKIVIPSIIGLIIGIIFIGTGWGEYNPRPGADVILGLRFLVGIYPAIVLCIGILFLYFYPIYGERLKENERMLAELHEKKKTVIA